MKEIWKEIPDCKNYEGSNLGKIRSIYHLVKTNNRNATFLRKCNGVILRPALNKQGYFMVNTTTEGISKSSILHRLIAKTFIPNPENKPQINHKNGIKTDNRIENLEWCTPKENIKHAKENGLIIQKYGQDHHLG